jgi:hypothetical protein
MYKYAKIGTLQNSPAAFFDCGLSQYISNHEDAESLVGGLFTYNPDDQFTQLLTEKELNEALSVNAHPLGNPVGHLQKAFDLFRKEGLEAKESDPQSSKAAFEDAALVADTIGSIENGLHRGQFEDDTLKEIEAGE